MRAKNRARGRGKALRPARGYVLKPLGRGRIALMRLAVEACQPRVTEPKWILMKYERQR
jgi:hypothetical protein